MKKVINIFGDITGTPTYPDDRSAAMIRDDVKDLTSNDEIEININCLGGDVFEAVAMRSEIARSQAGRVFNILGVCASAATMLFDSKDKVYAANGIMSMYHKPEVNASGTANTLRERAVLLDKIESENIIKNLVLRTGKPIDELSKLIEGEWWLTYDESINILGFLPLQKNAVFNKAKTSQIEVYNRYLNKKKALNSDAYNRYINFKNSLIK